MTSLLKKISLAGKKGLVTGIANQNSIAYGCARAFHELGAELMLTYAPAKSEAYVRPLAESLGQAPLMLCDVQDDVQLEATEHAVGGLWSQLWQSRFRALCRSLWRHWSPSAICR